jgi:hypothetical protein
MHEHSFSNIISKLYNNYHRVQLRSCALGLSAWLSIHPIISFFRMASDIFSLILHTKLGLPHPTIHGLSQCICSQAINPIGIHLLCCVHGGKHMATNDAIQNSFTSIVKDVGFHVLYKQTHLLSMPSFQTS